MVAAKVDMKAELKAGYLVARMVGELVESTDGKKVVERDQSTVD